MKRLLQIALLLAGLAWCVRGNAATAYVQKCINTGSGATTIACTITGVASNNFLAIGVVADAGAETLTSIAISSNTNATVSSNSPATNTGRAWIGYHFSITSGNLTVTATLSGTGTHSIWAREFSGVGAGAINANTAGTGTGAPALPSITNTAGDLLYSVCFTAGSLTNTAAPWAALDSPTQIQNGEADEYILSSSGSATATKFTGGSGNYACMGASFTPAAGATTFRTQVGAFSVGP